MILSWTVSILFSHLSMRSLTSSLVDANMTAFAVVIMGSIYSMVAGTMQSVRWELLDALIVTLHVMRLGLSVQMLAFFSISIAH